MLVEAKKFTGQLCIHTIYHYIIINHYSCMYACKLFCSRSVLWARSIEVIRCNDNLIHQPQMTGVSCSFTLRVQGWMSPAFFTWWVKPGRGTYILYTALLSTRLISSWMFVSTTQQQQKVLLECWMSPCWSTWNTFWILILIYIIEINWIVFSKKLKESCLISGRPCANPFRLLFLTI